VRLTLCLAIAAVLGLPAQAEENTLPSRCEATATFEYTQRGHEAHADFEIENPDCAASSGDFEVELRIRTDGNDIPEKLRFSEPWQRDDDAPVMISKRYPIGDNADLLRVRIRKLSCECTAADTEED